MAQTPSGGHLQRLQRLQAIFSQTEAATYRCAAVSQIGAVEIDAMSAANKGHGRWSFVVEGELEETGDEVGWRWDFRPLRIGWLDRAGARQGPSRAVQADEASQIQISATIFGRQMNANVKVPLHTFLVGWYIPLDRHHQSHPRCQRLQTDAERVMKRRSGFRDVSRDRDNQQLQVPQLAAEGRDTPKSRHLHRRGRLPYTCAILD